jgi:hypothetical protein
MHMTTMAPPEVIQSAQHQSHSVLHSITSSAHLCTVLKGPGNEGKKVGLTWQVRKWVGQPLHALQVPQLDKLLEVALHELKGNVVLNLQVMVVSQQARQDHDMSEVVHRTHHAVACLEQVNLQLDLK